MITMDVGQRLLVALVLKKDVMAFYGAKLQEKFFITESEKSLYTFIHSHLLEFSSLPDITTVEEKFGEMPNPPEPFDYYLKSVEERYGQKHFHLTLTDAAALLKKKEIKALQESLDAALLDYRAMGNRQIVMDFGNEAHDLYKIINAKNYAHDESLSIGWSRIDAQTHGMRGGDIFSFCGRPACLSGDTLIWVSRKSCSSGREYTLKQLYERFNGGVILSGNGYGKKLYWDLSIPTRINSLLDDGLTGLNEVQAVVYSGKKELYEVTTSKGNSIKTTLDHRFLTPTGYKELRDISVGDTVICKQEKAKKVKVKGYRTTPELTTKLPYSTYNTRVVAGIIYHRVPKCRLVYDAHLNGVHPDHFVEQLKTNPTHGFVFSDRSKEVHHIDGNYLNNDIKNLRLLTAKEHHALHHSQDNQRKKFGVYEVEPFEVTSITYAGIEDTYDISMADPYNNFVAQDFVVHNSGKTFLSLWVAYSVYMQAKKNVLFISMEMSRDILTYRMSAVLSKANMNELLSGEVSTHKLNDILTTLKGLQELPQKLYFVDGGLKTTTDDVNALIQQYKPSLVVIDGAYLLQHPNERINRYEKVAVNLEKLKQLAEMYRIPMVLSYQFNRKAAEKKAKGESAGLEDIGYCLRGDQIISTTHGLIRIEDAYRLGHVTTFDGIETKESKVIKSGVKLECTILFEDGTELICSPEHKLWISTRGSNYHWVRAEELRSGDTALTDITLNHYESPDSPLTNDMAEVVGLLIGACDCSSAIWSIPVISDYDDVLIRLNAILHNTYGYTGLVDSAEGLSYIDNEFIFDTPFVRRLLDLGVKQVTADKKEIPLMILSSSSASRGAFLRGLFEVLGHFTPLGINLVTPSHRLAQDTHILLKSLGIPSYVAAISDVYSVLVYKDYYQLFSKLIGFISKRKNRWLNEVLSLVKPPSSIRDDNQLYTLKITKVSISSVLSPMFDIAQEEGKHQFLANGILVHNSDVIPQISSVVLALKQPDSAETLKQRQLSVLKGRSGGEGTMVDIKWDFNKVDFSQIEHEDSDGDSNDDSHKYNSPTDTEDAEDAFSD